MARWEDEVSMLVHEEGILVLTCLHPQGRKRLKRLHQLM